MENKIKNVVEFLKWIKDKMTIAIHEENYEEAAVLRDIIIKYNNMNYTKI